MDAQGIRLPDRAFRDRYLTLLQAAGIKPDQARWHVLRVEQYLKIYSNLALAGHGPEHLGWFEGLGRESRLKDLGIIENSLGLTPKLPCASFRVAEHESRRSYLANLRT